MDCPSVIPHTLLDLFFVLPQNMLEMMDTQNTRQQHICWHSFENFSSSEYIPLAHTVIKLLQKYSAIISPIFTIIERDNSDHKLLYRFGSLY